MVEFGKRSRQPRDSDNDDARNQKRRGNARESHDNSGGELVVYRIICPNSIIGSVIGKGGKVINSIRNESRARIMVVDPFPGSDKRVITIYCHVKDRDAKGVNEDNMTPLCAAQDALIRVHDAMVNALANADGSDKPDREEAVLLVPASQASNVIGKSGSTIKRLRSKTNAIIKVTPKDSGDATHSCAMSFDNFVSISGDSEAVNRALFAVSSIMFRFLAREDIPLDTTVQEPPINNIISEDVPVFSASSFYPTADGSMAASIGTTELHAYPGNASAWPLYPSAIPVVSGFGDQPRSEELVIRVLCPSDKIGRVIGKGGSTVKSIRQSSGARVEVDDSKNESEECVITVSSSESTHDAKSATVEAILLLQGKINDEDDESANIRLLVPSKVVGCIIGKSGSVINEIRKKTKADIRVAKGDKPKCAASSDELVEVFGEVNNLRDALAQITLRLRERALKDGDENQNASSADASRMSFLSLPSALDKIPPVTHYGYDQRLEHSGGFGLPTVRDPYGFGSFQAHDNNYGSLSSLSPKMFGRLPPFMEMVIPANAVAKVLGKGGGNIENIRKISGAQIEIVDSKSSRSERVAQISGTTEQKRTAENLIQAFIMAT